MLLERGSTSGLGMLRCFSVVRPLPHFGVPRYLGGSVGDMTGAVLTLPGWSEISPV